jgi:hypothetical protein
VPTETFTTPDVWHSFVVPSGVTEVEVDVRGAGNGLNAGGRVAGTMSVNPGAQYFIAVGGQGGPFNGRQGGAGAWGGGGWGGNGRGNGTGGTGGGGGSCITVGTPPGWMRVVAGGAGGRSGDGWDNGGEGGADTGENGERGSSGSGGTVHATGGSQTAPGKGGRNQTAAPTYDGVDADNGPLARGGRGGQVPDGHSHGGGGGGGGWNSGGGGNASGGSSPGGGGGGGSNYSGGLVNVSANSRGGGNTGNGSVSISWASNSQGGIDIEENSYPPPPSDLKVEGVDLGSDTTTKVMTAATFTATLANPNVGEQTQMVLRIVAADNDDTTEEWNFTGPSMSFFSDWVGNVADGGDPIPVEVKVEWLWPNQKFYVRAYTLDSTGKWSQGMGDDPTEGGWSGGSFWTNRPPERPTVVAPSDNVHFLVTDNIFFAWTPRDPDDGDGQTAAEIRVRRLTSPSETVVTNWVTLVRIGDATASYTALASNFTGNQFYIWQVRTADSNGVWSEWTQANSFFVEAGTTPPVIFSPRRGEAVVAANTSVFKWRFLDPVASTAQTNADIRIRVVGTQDWITYYGEPEGMPGPYMEWVFPLETFIEGYHYEWQVRTYNGTNASDWSEVEDFWATAQPGQGLTPRAVLPEYESVAPPLGCGNNRVFIFDRGGRVMRGEITPLTTLRYGRLRDDISTATLFVNGFGKDCGALLSELRCWMHEIVIFRDGKRVWEGPVTRITAEPGQVEIEAKDVMAYIYRRIMRQGYNDAYRELPNGEKRGGLSVVRRAALTTMNALAYDDPNVLRWVTEIRHSDDAVQHRAVPDYSKMAWEEIDDLAANAGLDYTVVGRRIVYWDTHRPLGRLPEMRDEHFSSPVHVSEYGMQLANHFGVTNNSGVYGIAERGIVEQVPLYYGWVEQLVSAYGETEGDEGMELTDEARVSLEETLTEQADRGISPRWPTPVVVRVPDNSTINPDVNLGFDQLVPGVWIPVRAHGTIREVSQWQKLDSVTVEVTGDGGERIMVTMSPAPNGGSDPDADAAAVEAAQ